MSAFELVEDKQRRKARPDLAAALTQKAKEKGLILLSCGMYGNSIRFLMPITIEDEVLAEGLDIVEAGLEELAERLGASCWGASYRMAYAARRPVGASAA